MLKAMLKTKKGKTYRLEDMETQFVSLVRAGANRQTKFMVVKRDAKDETPVESADINENKEKDKSPSEVKPEDASGTNKEEAKAKDAEFLAMLEEAGSQVDGLLIDTQIDTAINDFVPAPSGDLGSGDISKSVQSGTRRNTHSDDEKNEELKKQIEAEREGKEQAQTELRKMRESLRKNEASLKRLRSTVGKSSALSYGEIESTEVVVDNPAPLWGTDLAEEAQKD